MTIATLDELILAGETGSAPRIYVACLASYNAGVLHGTWIDATDADVMREAIATMLRQSPYPNALVDCPNAGEPCTRTDHGIQCGHCCPLCEGSYVGKVPSAEEYAIHDYDSFGELSRQLGEYPDLEAVAMHARMIDLHGDAWFAYCDWQDADYQSEDDFEERYRGDYDTPADYAASFVENVYWEQYQAAGTFLSGYIDYEAIARDMQLGGDNYFAQRGGVTYVFDAH
jgi:antirestriction protein